MTNAEENSRQSRFQYSAETLRLLQLIESTDIEELRARAIDELVETDPQGASRILIEIFDRIMWRSTKTTIVRALGRTVDSRAVEFLIRLASNPTDLGLAKEAISSLGNLDTPMACEFLITLMKGDDYPRKKEAVTALAHTGHFPCRAEITEQLKQEIRNPGSQALVQAMILALGQKGARSDWYILEKLLPEKLSEENLGLVHAIILVAGKMGGRRAHLRLLKVDTKEHLLLHQLKLSALNQIALKKTQHIEDAIGQLLAEESADLSFAEITSILQSFSTREISEAYELLTGGGSVNLLLTAKIALNGEVDQGLDDFNEMLKRIEDHLDEVDLDLAASYFRGFFQPCDRKVRAKLLTQMSSRLRLAVLERLFQPEYVCEMLPDIIRDEKADRGERIAAINALANQALMSAFDSKFCGQVGKLMMTCSATVKCNVVRDRLHRGLGQIGYCESTSLVYFNNLLKKNHEGFRSTYYALGLLQSPKAAEAILRRVLDLLKKNQDGADMPEFEQELEHAMGALSRFDTLPDLSELATLDLDKHPKVQISMLKCLTQVKVEAFISFVLENLNNDEFQRKILAIAATKHNHNDEIWQVVASFRDAENPCIRGRAIDSLAAGGSLAQHVDLAQWALDEIPPKWILLKIFRGMAPNEEEDYTPIVERIDQMIADIPDVRNDSEVTTAAINLRDNLVAEGFYENFIGVQHIIPTRPTNEAIIRLDELLAEELPDYPCYSDTVKSILRNAEMTYRHTELFDTSVDKSTVVIEYVKSIDIMLQETIGKQIFLSSEDLLVAMQARVLKLGLDEEGINAPVLIEKLKCGTHFGPEDFPAHKLIRLSNSIISGRIMHDQFRAIDGLRAWSLLLLLFARTYYSHGTALTPVFPVGMSDNDRMCAVALELNNLQQSRNLAAHRGTVVVRDEIDGVRLKSLNLLKELASVLGRDRIFRKVG